MALAGIPREEPVVTRQTYARPPLGARSRGSAAPTGSRSPGDVEALLALQRQIGNAGVGALLGRDPVQRSRSAPVSSSPPCPRRPAR